MRLYLIRHGQSFTNVANWDTLPHLDVGLTDKGQQQAASLRDWLKQSGSKADALYCSTMLRAQETARYVAEALDCAPIQDDRLREITGNYASGQPVEAENLPRKFVDRWATQVPFSPRSLDIENVESWSHLRIRVGQFVEDLLQHYKGRQVYVVAHGGVLSAFCDNFFNVPMYRRCDVHHENTGMTLFEHWSNTSREPWHLHFLNRIDHLAGLSS